VYRPDPELGGLQLGIVQLGGVQLGVAQLDKSKTEHATLVPGPN
jgi:hypothetical protein